VRWAAGWQGGAGVGKVGGWCGGLLVRRADVAGRFGGQVWRVDVALPAVAGAHTEVKEGFLKINLWTNTNSKGGVTGVTGMLGWCGKEVERGRRT
jgi:hypothetical protein